MDPRKMHTRGSAESDHAWTSRASRGSSGEKRAAEALLEIRQHLEAGEIRMAKRLVSDAVRRHPSHSEIRDLHHILNQGRSFARQGTGRDMRSEYAWLRHPPEKYRGRWVALIGDAVVASAKTLQELQASLPSDLCQTPLAVEIPA